MSKISAGFSEDSDYTSDINFPVNGQIPNAATSQYLPIALHRSGGLASATASANQHPASGGGAANQTPHSDHFDQSHYDSSQQGVGFRLLFAFH